MRLKGKRGLVVGIANAKSIATGCARVFVAEGARLAITHQDERALPHVRPVAEELGAELLMPLDVTRSEQMDTLFTEIARHWGGIDFLLHSIAFCPSADLHARVMDASAQGFAQAMDISCHSFLRLARHAEPLMEQGGSLITVSYYGAEKVVDHYNIMGPVKAALEAATRYIAVELGPRRIRANVISPGPIETRAASGIAHFDGLIADARNRAAEGRLVSIDEVGQVAAFLASDAASGLTGTLTHIDAGRHVRM